eukprot:TRINITY_DN38852_c0_g1_i1.p1 TRINITY_DN38852_c0_g1~~TRINITY_DN38852_c0_g1_i1.p1  ORF type:complete len:588 (-),score=56.15 TRINITY_DN38852_c0_g1_i1:110-1873(-)
MAGSLFSLLFPVAPLLVAARQGVDHCTGFAAGPRATLDGSSLVGQTDDAEGGPGSSVVFVPAEDHSPGSFRPVLDQETSKVIGRVPQVPHTFAYSYATGGYGLMNEHKVAFGESTCSARITAKSLAHNGTALFSNKELSMIALERCTTARCALELMGNLSMHGGFYGEDYAVDTGGETLLVADPHEVWVFHILADPTGRSSIWAAQRVPDDHVVVVPNTFVIREMDLKSDKFMLSPNALDIARQFGWWDGQGTFDFSKAFSLGEYANPHYSSRRMWRAYNLLAPSVRLDPSRVITDKDGAYPFSLKPDRLLTLEDVIAVYRDYYEGTPFSLVGDSVAAGPFNSPLRIAGGAGEDGVPNGAWERPISIYRTDYGVINSCPSDGHGLVWYAPHTPHASVFSPAWSSAATAVARPYVVDKAKSVDRASLFWAVSAVSNWAFGSMFSHVIKDIRAAQADQEDKSKEFAAQLAKAPAEEHNARLAKQAAEVHAAWWEVFWSLMGKYNDGYIITHGAGGAVTSTAVGYPKWWLEATNFASGVDAPAAAFVDLKERMAVAAKQMQQIEADRAHPPRVSPQAPPAASAVVPLVVV